MIVLALAITSVLATALDRGEAIIDELRSMGLYTEEELSYLMPPVVASQQDGLGLYERTHDDTVRKRRFGSLCA